MKTCSKCGEVKPLEQFGRDRSRVAGHRAECLKCAAARKAEWRRRRPDKQGASRKRDWKRDRENPQVLEATRARRRAWAKRNPEYVAIALREWKDQNRDKVRDQDRRQQAARRGVPFTDFAAEYLAVLSRDPCTYCLAQHENIDHIVPIAGGGDGDWNNLTSACASCNCSKGKRPLLVFLATR